MSIMLSDIYYPCRQAYSLSYISDSGSLLKPVSWIYVTEDIDTTNFLRGNELVITTGLSAKSSFSWLTDFIKSLIAQHCSALLINTGYYIKNTDITDEIICLCKENNFVLMTMPWKVHIADVMQDFCNRIIMNSYSENNIAEAFRTLILKPESAAKILPDLEDAGIKVSHAFLVIAIESSLPPLSFEDILNQYLIHYYIYPTTSRYILILDNPEITSLRKAIDAYYELIQTKMPEMIPVQMGIGHMQAHLENLHFSYSNAIAALKWSLLHSVFYTFFDDMGIYRILSSVEDKSLLSDICQERLDVLEKHDKENGTDLLHTLSAFFQSDCNIKKTAAVLFVHRNTINYRMNIIHELLNCDLSSEKDRFDYQMAFYIRDLSASE